MEYSYIVKKILNKIWACIKIYNSHEFGGNLWHKYEISAIKCTYFFNIVDSCFMIGDQKIFQLVN